MKNTNMAVIGYFGYDEEDCIDNYGYTYGKNARNKGNRIRQVVSDYTLFDIETTGKSIYTAKITEIAAVKVRNSEIVDKFNQLVNPGEIIPLDIIVLTGITNEMVEGMPTIDEVLPKFLEFIGDDIIVGHNINSYDLNIIYDIAQELLGVTVYNDFVDTMDLAHCLNELDVPNYKLSTLCDFWGIKNDNVHRAYSDVSANNECYQKMKEYTVGEYKSPFVKKEAKEFYFPKDITDKRICVTGDFKCGDRKVVTAKLKEYGAKVTTTVNSKTDYLLVGDLGTTTTHKFDDAAQFGTAVVYEKDFIIVGIDEAALKSITSKETLFDTLMKNCQAVIHELGIQEKYLEVNMSEGNKENSQQAVSVFLGDKLCYRVIIQKRGYKLEISKDIAKYMDLSQISSDKNALDFVVAVFDNIDNLLMLCNDMLTTFYKHYTPSERFGCCGKYIECSNQAKCLHDDIFYAKACQYRENLEKGHIFYGENCNF